MVFFLFRQVAEQFLCGRRRDLISRFRVEPARGVIHSRDIMKGLVKS
jgi:hypothetical protein